MAHDNGEFQKMLAAIKAGAAIPKYEIDLKNGRFSASDGDDHGRLMETLKFLKQENLLVQKVACNSQEPAVVVPASPVTSAPLDDVIQRYLVEMQRLNKPRTAYAKKRHLVDFTKHGPKGTSDFSSIGKSDIVAYKDKLVQLGNKPKTLDNKLMTANDLFKYASNHGFYKPNENPVSGLLMQSGAMRQSQSEHYQMFSTEDLAVFFEPTAYIEMMDKPDLFWGPLIALYTGMRISEVTALRIEDIQNNKGVMHFCVTDSKTKAGIRGVPIAQALLDLGVLNYINEVRSAGFERLFPHLRLINNSYQKKLSEGMRKRLNSIGFSIQDRKSFHSFRANVITQLTDKSCNDGQVYQLTGHQLLGQRASIHRGYIGELSLLKPVIDTLSWPSIDLPALKYDGRFQSFLQKLK